MHKLLSILLIAIAATTASAADAKWLTDFEAAKAQAQKENKPILMDFTGSDWCPPCKALKKKVFSSPQFAKYAAEKLVLLELDFPNDKSKVTREVAAQNDKLSDQFNIKSFPTIVILDKGGKEVGRISDGYAGDSPAAYIQKLDAIVAKAK